MLGNLKTFNHAMVKLLFTLFSTLLLVSCATAVFEEENSGQTRTSTQPSSWPSNTVAVFSQGVQSLGKDNESARISFAEAIELSPQMEPAYYNLAKLDFDQKNYEAVDNFHAQIKSNNVSSARLNNLFATNKRQQNDFQAAKILYLAAIKIDPGYTPALLNLAILNDVYLGEIVEAEKYYLLYQQQLEQQNKQDDRLKNWLTDIQRRISSKNGSDS